LNLLVTALFFLGWAFSSLYVFPSGNPQPTDFLLAASSAWLLVSRFHRLNGMLLLWPMIALTIWVAIVSGVWTALYPHGTFFRPPLFFVFNLLLMFAVINFFAILDDPRAFFTRGIEAALLVSSLGILISLSVPGLLMASESARVTGFFNNPNQLAYYSLCMMGALLVLHNGRLPLRLVTLFAFGSGVIGVFTAASLGAMAGFVFLLIGLLLANWQNARWFIRAMGAIFVVVVIVVGFDVHQEGAISDRVETRLDRVERKIDDLETERAYHRVLDHPEYWVFGAGEGSTERFPGYGTGEIHSSLGNLLFAYGVVGLGLFLLLLWKALRHAPLYVWSVLAAPMVYSLTHMGLRTSAFWLLLVLVLVIYGKKEQGQSGSARIRVRSWAPSVR
jgi:hypothetical protein